MRDLLKCERGVAAAEYALLLAMVGIALGAALLALAHVVSTSITDTAAKVDYVASNS
jgi:Flp pilus assembly pilin Flp